MYIRDLTDETLRKFLAFDVHQVNDPSFIALSAPKYVGLDRPAMVAQLNTQAREKLQEELPITEDTSLLEFFLPYGYALYNFLRETQPELPGLPPVKPRVARLEFVDVAVHDGVYMGEPHRAVGTEDYGGFQHLPVAPGKYRVFMATLEQPEGCDTTGPGLMGLTKTTDPHELEAEINAALEQGEKAFGHWRPSIGTDIGTVMLRTDAPPLWEDMDPSLDKDLKVHRDVYHGHVKVSPLSGIYFGVEDCTNPRVVRSATGFVAVLSRDKELGIPAITMGEREFKPLPEAEFDPRCYQRIVERQEARDRLAKEKLRSSIPEVPMDSVGLDLI